MLRKITAQQAREWGAVRWVKPLIDVLLDGTAESAHLTARHIVTNSNYVRLQVDLSAVNDDLDDASPENISALEALAHAHMDCENGVALLDQIENLLCLDQNVGSPTTVS